MPMTPVVKDVQKRRSKLKTKYLFAQENGKPMTENVALKHLNYLQRDAEVDTSDRRLHWHTFRRYFVKDCMLKGVALNALMEWTGHDTINMALEYGQSDIDDSMREVEKII